MKRFAAIAIFGLILNLGLVSPAYALGILPRSSLDCELQYGVKKGVDGKLDPKNEKGSTPFKKAFQSSKGFQDYAKANDKGRDDILGCAVKLGLIKLYMVPIYITYLVEFLLELAGLIAVLFVVYGGYLYVIGGLGEDKEKGKNAIKHALLGLVIALSAWIIVNFVQIALTS